MIGSLPTARPWTYTRNPDAEARLGLPTVFEIGSTAAGVALVPYSKANAEFITNACNGYSDLQRQLAARDAALTIAIAELTQAANSDYSKRKTADALAKIAAIMDQPQAAIDAELEEISIERGERRV